MKEYIREVKQITATNGIVYALCNDGSMWRNMGGSGGSGGWYQVADIPKVS